MKEITNPLKGQTRTITKIEGNTIEFDGEISGSAAGDYFETMTEYKEPFLYPIKVNPIRRVLARWCRWLAQKLEPWAVIDFMDVQ